MKISELVAELGLLWAEHGDLEVSAWHEWHGQFEPIQNVAHTETEVQVW